MIVIAQPIHNPNSHPSSIKLLFMFALSRCSSLSAPRASRVLWGLPLRAPVTIVAQGILAHRAARVNRVRADTTPLQP